MDIVSEEFRQDVWKHEGSPPWESGHFVRRVPTGCQKIMRAVHLEKMDILSEEFQKDFQKLSGQSTLRKWTSCRKTSDKMSKNPRLVFFQSCVGSSPEPLAGCDIWKLWHSSFDPPWENGNIVGRVPTLDLLFNLGWGVLLSYLLVTRFENYGTLRLTHLEKMDTESPEDFRQDVQKSWTCCSILGWQFY